MRKLQGSKWRIALIVAIGGLIFLGMYLLVAWLVMVVWNGIAGHFNFTSIGYWVALLITLALGIVSGFFRGMGR